MYIINKKYFEAEMLFRSWYLLGLGISMGCNHFYGRKVYPKKIKIPKNLFVEVDILFWTISFEFKGY